MSLLGFLLHVATGAFSVLVCGYTAAHLARSDGRIPWRRIDRWRLAGALLLLALGVFQALRGQATLLQCNRDVARTDCRVLRSGLLGTQELVLPDNTLIGAEIDEQVGEDHEGWPTVSRRVALVTRQGRIALTHFDQGDAIAMQQQIATFLGDGRQQTLEAGADDRAFHWLAAPVWLALGLLVVCGRWD